MEQIYKWFTYAIHGINERVVAWIRHGQPMKTEPDEINVFISVNKQERRVNQQKLINN